MSDDSESLLMTRAGHVSELTAMRLDEGELNAAEEAIVRAHIDGCEPCSAALAADRALDAAVDIRPPAAIAPPRARVIPLWPLAAVVAAAAAVVLFIVAKDPPERPLATNSTAAPGDDAYRVKAGEVSLAVFVHDGTRDRRASSDEVVHPGDRLRFRVTARRGGHVLVAGIDSRGEAYVCAPSDGRSQALTAGETTTLADAVELDDVLGSERIVAIVCPEPFRFDEIATRLHADDLGDAGDGCQRDSLVLLKR